MPAKPPSSPSVATQQQATITADGTDGTDTDEDTDISLDPNQAGFPGCQPNNASANCPTGAGDDVVGNAGDPVDPLDQGVMPAKPPSSPPSAGARSARVASRKGTALEASGARARRLREKRDAARKAEAARLRRKKAKVHAKLNSLRGKEPAKGQMNAKHVSKPHVAAAAKHKASLVAAKSTGKNNNAARFAAQPAVMLLGGDASTKVYDTDEHDTY